MQNNSDLVQISLDEISSDAIKESIKKFTRLLIEGWYEYEEKYRIPWTTCNICTEVARINDHWHCANCPLQPSKWCTERGKYSRLHIKYYGHNTITDWEKDVNDYIWWFTIELETRDNYDNHAELQTMGIVG
jgi:hypothetical protein